MKWPKANADKMVVDYQYNGFWTHGNVLSSRQGNMYKPTFKRKKQKTECRIWKQKKFSKKVSKYQPYVFPPQNHLIYKQIEIACSCESIRNVSWKYHPSVSRTYQNNPFETLPRTQCADYVPEKASRNRGFGMCTTPWAQDARGVGKACPKSVHWFGQWKNRGDFTITTSAGLCSAFSSLILSDISLTLSWHFRMSAKHAIYLYIRHVV